MIRVFHWNPTTHKVEAVALEALPKHHSELPENSTWWLDLHAATPEEEARVFNGFMPVHPLVLEDITKPRREPEQGAHLPKVEEFEDYLFVIVNPLPPGFGAKREPGQPRHIARMQRPQLSAILSHNMVITHHDATLSCVEATWQHCLRHGECAKRGPDFLFHLVLDALVDEYAPVVESIAERLDTLETRLFRRPVPQVLTQLMKMKRDVMFLRKTLVHEREVLARLIRSEFRLVSESEIVYYRNVYDHLVRYTELTENAREMVSDLMQTHLAAVSNRLNEIMKVLTMISTTVLPMTLIAGIYGMNFKHMPELEWEWGYGLALGLMLAALVASLGYFRWKRWL
jgi:magnesium transporter